MSYVLKEETDQLLCCTLTNEAFKEWIMSWIRTEENIEILSKQKVGFLIVTIRAYYVCR